MRQVRLLLLAVVWACAFSASPALAQGRYEGSSSAEQRLRRGQKVEAEAEARKASRPEESRELYEDALALYEEALEEDAGLLDAYVRVGYVYYALGQADKAATRLRAAVQRWPESPKLRRVYGTVLFGLEGRRGEAVTHLNIAAGAFPDAFDVFFLLGKHHYELRQWSPAAKWFRRYLQFRDKDARAHGTLGNIYLRLNKLEPALAQFRLVQSLQPGNLAAQTNIANIRFKQERYKEAATLFEDVLKKKPSLLGARFNLASSYYELARYEDAIKTWQVFLERKPGYPLARYMIAVSQIERGQTDLARRSLQGLIKDQPKHAKAHWRLGLLALAEDAVIDARRWLDQAAKLEPEDPWILKSLGDVMRHQSEADQALRVHSTALKLSPREPLFYAAVSRDHMALGQVSKARGFAGQAFKLKPEDDVLRDLFAVVLLHHGRQALTLQKPGETRADLVLLKTIAVRKPEALLLEATLHLSGGDVVEAQAMLTRARPLAKEAGCTTTRCPARDWRRLQAHLYLAAQQGREALEVLEVDAKGSADGQTSLLLGRAYAATEDWAQALVWFSKAKGQGMQSPVLLRNLALSAVHVSAQLGKRRQWRQAQEVLKEAQSLRAHLSRAEAIELDLAMSYVLIERNNASDALGLLRQARKDLRALDAQERARLPADDVLALDLRQAFLLYRLGRDDRAVDLLERTSLRKGTRRKDVTRLLTALYVRSATVQYKAGRAPAAREFLRKAHALTQGRDDIVEHNLAVLEFARKPASGKSMKTWASTGRVPESLYNYAIYLDETKKDRREAFNFFLKAEKSGVEAKISRERINIKRRVFGWTP